MIEAESVLSADAIGRNLHAMYPEGPVILEFGGQSLSPLYLPCSGFLKERPVDAPKNTIDFQRGIQRFRTLAAVHVMQYPEIYGRYDCIMPLGGRTAGDEWPSESEVASDEIAKLDHTIATVAETASIDSQENFGFSQIFSHMTGLGRPGVITNVFYEDWIRFLTKQVGAEPIEIFDAHQICRAISPELAQEVDVFEKSVEFQNFWLPRAKQSKQLMQIAKIPGAVRPLLWVAHRKAIKQKQAETIQAGKERAIESLPLDSNKP